MTIRLDDNEHRVLVAIRPHISGRVYHEELARASHLSRASLPRILNRLIEKGAIRRVYPGYYETYPADYILPRVADASKARKMGARG